MLTLGIETSCDETAVALIEDGRVLSSEVSSSVHLHAEYGGVVPEIASRYHMEYLLAVFDKALQDANRVPRDIDLIAVTESPGLPGALLVGMSFAKGLSFGLDVPIIKIDHVHSHIISTFIKEDRIIENITNEFPFCALVISGGHTSFYDVRSLTDFKVIGRTLDDAVGEAFDKVSKILGLGYPGGPVIEQTAKKYSWGKEKINFPKAFLEKERELDFSLSGIKTAVLYYWRDAVHTEEEKQRVAFSFQSAVFDVVEAKILKALKFTGYKTIAVGGGVINNEDLRQRIRVLCERESIKLYLPDKKYSGDNGAMVGIMGELCFVAKS
ncbi:glycoprotease family metalloendopeptidase [Candidatus Omnitrophus magneticus]|uniref:tRNA N6-adenosine threonylcarbamoyltransferase n=1 Tax=Candidatus Omnitrophus magneticus TaxID=1609969 RepID=A0A0F0CQ60_9BACT|nr:glycoprotease family metalloendopeptidase [Candidatus Omnitrophus magneticus]